MVGVGWQRGHLEGGAHDFLEQLLLDVGVARQASQARSEEGADVARAEHAGAEGARLGEAADAGGDPAMGESRDADIAQSGARGGVE